MSLSAVLLSIQVFWNVKLSHWVQLYRRFEESIASTFRFKNSKKTSGLQGKELRFIETSEIVYTVTFNFQLRKFI